MPYCEEPILLLVLDRTYPAICVFRSDNFSSLVVAFEGAIWIHKGAFLRNMLLQGDPATGAYKEIFTGTPVKLTRSANANPA